MALLASWLAVGCGAVGDESVGALPTRPSLSMLLAGCSPSGDELACTARLVGAGDTRDVTTQATWIVQPPAAGTFAEPGRLVPRVATDVRIVATYQGVSNEPVEFRVAPGAPAQALTFLGVSALDTSRAGIFRARIEILTGTGAGGTCFTNESGYCSMRGILVGAPLRIRAAADGFDSVERDHQVDPFPGPGSPFLTLLLSRTTR